MFGDVDSTFVAISLIGDCFDCPPIAVVWLDAIVLDGDWLSMVECDWLNDAPVGAIGKLANVFSDVVLDTLRFAALGCS